MVGSLPLTASATATVVSRRWNDDDEMSVALVEEPGVPGGNHRPTATDYIEYSTAMNS